MSVSGPLQKLNLRQFADRFRSEMVPLGARFCYFAAAVSLSAEDLREYLDEPVAALPPTIAAKLPEIQILLVPYIARPAKAKDPDAAFVATEPPDPTNSLSAGSVVTTQNAVLAFAIKDTEVADYHYRFYRSIAEIAASDPASVPTEYADVLRDELRSNTHGEVDEASWTMKIELTDTDQTAKRATKRFREYARQSFIDTLTLYLHGICCDIDVETGPRQLPSHRLRKRLRLLKSLFPPPEGYAVLPEDLKEPPAKVKT